MTGKILLTYYFPMQPTTGNVSEVFSAISCPARRQILDLLVEGDKPVKKIAEHFEMSRPAISQHLRILLVAGLVSEQRQGREHRYKLVPERLGPVRDWIAHYEKFWDGNFKRLETVLAKRSQR